MQFVLKIVRSKPFDALMSGLFGLLVGAVIFVIINVLQELILAALFPAWPPDIVVSLVLPGLAGLLILGTGAFGFAAG